MSKIYFKSLLIIGFIFVSFAANAQFEVSGELRPRFEANNGSGNTPTVDDQATFYVQQRTRLNVSLKKENYSFYVSLQDIRIWGSDNVASKTGSNYSTGTFGVHQAWGEFNFCKNSAIRVGRQTFSYDDSRLLSGRNWTQAGVSYDAVLYKFKKGTWQFDLAASYNNDALKGSSAGFGEDYFDVTPIEYRLRTVDFAYVKKDISDAFSISFLALMTGQQKNDSSNVMYLRGTYGLYGQYKKPQGLNAKVNLYFQNGKNQKGKEVSAFLATAEVTYNLKHSGIGVGVDYLSGDDAKSGSTSYNKKDHAFNLLYGTRQGKLGNINQFTLTSHTLNGGLTDIYPKVFYKPNAKSKISLTYHMFSLPNAVVSPNPEGIDDLEYLEGSIGSELDINFNYAFSKTIDLQAGFGYYFTNDTFSKMKNITPSEIGKPYFGWLMLTFKPVLFQSEK